MSTDEERTIFCGNLSNRVSEEVLYELFLQAAPLEKVKIPVDKDGRQNSYAFITFKHAESVRYAICLLNGLPLYDRKLNLKPRSSSQQVHNQSPAQVTNVKRPNLNEMVLSGQVQMNNFGKRSHYDYSPVSGREKNFDRRNDRQDHRNRNNNNRFDNEHRGNYTNGPYNRRRFRLS